MKNNPRFAPGAIANMPKRYASRLRKGDILKVALLCCESPPLTSGSPHASRLKKRIVPESRDPVAQRPDSLDLQFHDVTGSKELSAPLTDTGRCARENDVARIERHADGQLRDLFGQREDHLAGVGILLDHVVDPQLEREVLRVGDVLGRYHPRPQRTGAVEAFLAR